MDRTSYLSDKAIKHPILGLLSYYIQKIAWILFLVFLPVTSFPYFPSELGGDSIVRPLSLFPLLVLLFLVTIPYLFNRTIPKTFLSLLPFILVATISSLFSLLQGINSTFGVSVADRLIRTLITLAVGGTIYLTVSVMDKTFVELRSTLRWIYVGFSLALFWGTIQAVYIIHYSQDYYQFVSSIQNFVSSRRLFENRVSGLTYEPNWFAEQIGILVLPWLFAAVLNNHSVFRWRWRWLSIEWLLLIWSVIILVFTFSRAGLLNLFALLILIFLFFRPTLRRALSQGTKKRNGVGRRAVEALLVVTMIGSFVYLAGFNNEFFSRMWNYWSNRSKISLEGYLDYIGFSARYIYNATAFRIYASHPVLGVGLGNYAFYFEDMMPERLLAETPEVLHLITLNTERYRLMTPKNLYLRILAETGLAGLATFSAFIIAILGCALYLYLSREPEERYWGTASLFALVSFLLNALTFDSFAIPNMWVVFGLITAAAWISRRAQRA